MVNHKLDKLLSYNQQLKQREADSLLSHIEKQAHPV